jgi:hypothetical protein
MREHCRDSKKSVVEYKFKNKPQRKFISHKNPISVEVRDYDSSDWDYFNKKGAEITFYLPIIDGLPESVWTVARGYGYKVLANKVRIIDCTAGIGSTLNKFSENLPDENFIGRISIDENKVCPQEYNGCSIKIYERGVKVFEDFGQAPCKYKIKCEGRCEKSDLEITTTSHPGFWCFTPPMQQELRRLTEKINRTKL